MPLRVLHLIGSPQSDALDELSRLYARGCLVAVADPDRFQPVLAHVSPGGTWRFPVSLDDAALAGTAGMGVADAMLLLEALDIDVMVPHMFCQPGMTAYRALFDVLGIPYVGNPPEVMAMAARKDLVRAVVAAAGVSVPLGAVIDRGDPCPLPLPVIVKPVAGDNSDGLSLVCDESEFADAVAAASPSGAGVLVEQFLAPGREVRCGVLERGSQLIPLPLEEYPVSWAAPIRRAQDKLSRTEGALRLVAKGDERAWIVDREDPIVAAVHAAAIRAYRALGCRHYGLFDFRIDSDGHLWFLEAGPYCSFSPQSVVTTMAAAAGTPVTALFAEMIGLALGANSAAPA